VIQKSVSARHLEMADFVVNPKVGHIRWDRLGRVDELIDSGYEAGLESITKIRALIDSARNKELQSEEMLAQA
jgi:predicted acylesterase/phospholipase RssA